MVLTIINRILQADPDLAMHNMQGTILTDHELICLFVCLFVSASYLFFIWISSLFFGISSLFVWKHLSDFP